MRTRDSGTKGRDVSSFMTPKAPTQRKRRNCGKPRELPKDGQDVLNDVRQEVQHIRVNCNNESAARELGHFVNSMAEFQGSCGEVATLCGHLEVAIPLLNASPETRLFAEAIEKIRQRFQHAFCPGC